MSEFKFTDEQTEILRNIQDIDDLLKLFKKIIYISGCSYVDLSSDIQDKFDMMIEEMFY